MTETIDPSERPFAEAERVYWPGPGPGWDQIGRTVETEGRKGKVVGGSGLTILVEWGKE